MEILKIKSLYYTRFNCIFTRGCIFDLISSMGLHRPNIAVYSSENKIKGISKPADILDLLKKNKREERKEKVSKIFVTLSLLVLFLFLGLLIFA